MINIKKKLSRLKKVIAHKKKKTGSRYVCRVIYQSYITLNASRRYSTWEEPNDEAVYCLDTDGVNTVVTGTNRHGRVGVWDLRCFFALFFRSLLCQERVQTGYNFKGSDQDFLTR